MLASTITSLRRAKPQDINNVRAVLRRRPLQLLLLLDKGLVFSPTGLNLTSFDPPSFQKPIHQRSSRCSGLWSSPPMMIAGQKQLNPCPIMEQAATVDSTELVNSSRSLRASRWNSLFKYELPIFLRAASTRLPDKNSASAIGGNFE